VPPSLLQRYCEGGEAQKGATAALLSVVETALAAVTVSAPDYETLEFFWTLRRLIKTGTGPMSLSQQVNFARLFAAAHARAVAEAEPPADDDAGSPEAPPRADVSEGGGGRLSLGTLTRLKAMAAEYNSTLKSFGLRDYQVVSVMAHMSRGRAASLLALRALLLVVYSICLAPASVLGLPLLLARGVASLKARQAVAQSSVKLKGTDVVATWKLLVALVLVPLMWCGYTAAACILGEALPAPWSDEVCLLAFFFLPFLAYGAVLAGDRLLGVARSLPPLLAVVLYPDYRWQIVDQRRALLEAMQALVDEHGWLDEEGVAPSPVASPLQSPQTPPLRSG